jgi:hypothetical protein
MDGYVTPVEQMLSNLTLTCPNAPARPILRPDFQEPLKSVKLALPMTRPIHPQFGGLTLKGYGSPKNSK